MTNDPINQAVQSEIVKREGTFSPRLAPIEIASFSSNPKTDAHVLPLLEQIKESSVALHEPLKKGLLGAATGAMTGDPLTAAALGFSAFAYGIMSNDDGANHGLGEKKNEAAKIKLPFFSK